MLDKTLTEEANAIGETIPRNSLSKLNDEQLWTIYMALLSHNTPKEPLKSTIKKLAWKVWGIGERKYDWA